MNSSEVNQLVTLLEQQFECLSSSDIEALKQLEDEKTQLLQRMFASQPSGIDQELKVKLEYCAQKQADLEECCVSVRDELGKSIAVQLHREKALQAYADADGKN